MSLLSVYGTHPMLIWGMGFYKLEEPDSEAVEKQREASRIAMAKARERRIDALLQQGYSRELITASGYLRKRGVPSHDDQS
jgi:hypothetical protein